MSEVQSTQLSIPEEEITEPDGPFSLDKEAMESLRLEAQSISPEEQAEFQEIISDAYRIFLNKFREYIDNPLDASDVARRFILSDEETKALFDEAWPDNKGKTIIKYHAGESLFRAYNSEGQYVVGIPQNVWDKLTEKNKEVIIQQNGGNEEMAKKFVKKALHQNFILHEITHLYQPGDEKVDIPLWLRELQAYWVGRELADENSRVHSEYYDKLADFFQKLLDKYGDDVHKLCLSKARGHNTFVLYKIKEEFTPEIQADLFPDYREVKPENPA
jgi:hypothetical protein